jgi:IS605 OrfB family transposase
VRAHGREDLSTINVLAQALDCGVLPDEGKGASPKDCSAARPSAVTQQALRDAHSVWHRSCALGRLPVVRKPLCPWNHPNGRIEGAVLLIPVSPDGQLRQLRIRCARRAQEGPPGLRRLTGKRGQWMAAMASTLPPAAPTREHGIRGGDRGVKMPAGIPVVGTGARGTRSLGNGRAQRMRRRRCSARRTPLQGAGTSRAVRKSQGKERRWMRDITHQLSRPIGTHAQDQSVGSICLAQLAGIRQRTARTRRGANARQNNRMIATWPFYQLNPFGADQAGGVGMRVESVDPASTSQTGPACFARHKAHDRRAVCGACGWTGHRDEVGAIPLSRRAGLPGERAGAARA